MSLPTMDEFEVKNADLAMEEDSEPEINDIGFDAVINENENEFLEYSSNDDDIQDVSDQEILDSLAKKRPRYPGFVVTTKDKIDLYRDKYLENIKKKRNGNGNNEDILKYDKWMAYINEGSEVVQPNKKRKLIQPELGIDFRDLNLSRAIMNAINDLKWKTPTPVQKKSIPIGLKGNDVLVNAVTGSGKTGAFVIPVLERLQNTPMISVGSRVIIITPTRELAVQCFQMTKKLSKYIKPKVRVGLVVGGLNMEDQESILRSSPDIIVCTPGRMIDLCRNSHGISLYDIEVFILDEADRLLDMGFRPEIQELVKHIPKKRQTMLFSATLSEEILKFASFMLLKDYVKISVDPVICLNKELTQEFIRVHHGQNQYRQAMILGLCLKTFKDRVIIFCRTKVETHQLRLLFGLFGLNAAELHGNLTQMDRLNALNEFRHKKVDYLLCTDVAARGLDIPNIKTVINIEFPTNIKVYIHRVGRTARAGNHGYSVTLVGESRRKLLKKLVETSKNNDNNATLKSRTLNNAYIQWLYKEIESIIPLLKEISREETIERDLRLAQIQLDKSSNIVQHSNAIFRRNKSWHMSNKDKKLLKEETYFDNINDDLRKSIKDKIDKRTQMNEQRKLKLDKKHNKIKKDNTSNLTFIERERLKKKEDKKIEKKHKQKQMKFAKKIAQEAVSLKKQKKREKIAKLMAKNNKIMNNSKKMRNYDDNVVLNRIDIMGKKELQKNMLMTKQKHDKLKRRITNGVKRKTKYLKRRKGRK